MEGVPRRLDVADLATRRGVEIKTGKQYATQDNLWEVLRDEILVNERGWDISWHFTQEPSGPLEEALKRANIPFTVGPM